MKNEYTYIEAPEIAKLIRTDLKAAFPGVKFSVKSSRYSMGSSVSISWVDGPTTKQVDYAVALYDFCTYDPYQDLHGTCDARLINGQLRKGSAHISASRETSVAVAELVVKSLNWAESYNVQVVAHMDGTANITADDYNIQRRCWEALSQWTAFPEVADRDEVEPEQVVTALGETVLQRDAAVRADIEKIEAAFAGKVEASQTAPGRYSVFSREAVRASGEFLAQGTVAELLTLAEEAAVLLAPLARKMKPRVQVWSDGTIVLTPDLWVEQAGRVLN